jgi:NAD(P)-dependent dehydrogenase (short-subunit alcohol dehydrogenase family)
MQDFEGKVAVVTGAASGIGRALTEKCLSEGMSVVMSDIEEDVLMKVAEELQARGNNTILPVRTDVSILKEIEQLKRKTLDTFGAVHLLFNNAGVSGEGNSWESTQKEWEWVIGVNLWSVVHGVRTFVPQMISQDTQCHIVNTASVAGLIGGSTNASYSATKHAVVALTENLYRDLGERGHSIGASVLCPGLINTNILDSARNRPDHLGREEASPPVSEEREAGRAMFAEALRNGMQPSELADIVFEGIRAKRLYIQTHDMFNGLILSRANDIVNGTNPEPINLLGEE